MSKILWNPSEKKIKSTNMYQFMGLVNQRFNKDFTDYDSLYHWSVENIPDLWATIWEFCGIKASQRYDKVIDDEKKMPGAQWFTGARLNFAENLLRYRDDYIALVFHGVGCSTLTAAGEPRLVLVLTVPVPVIALAGHLAVIPRYGMTGAAAVSLAVTVLGASLVLIAVARVWHTRPGSATVIRAGLTSVVVGLASSAWSAAGFWLVVKLPVLTVLGLILLLVLREVELAEIRAAISEL